MSKTPITYYGGKQRLSKIIIPMIPLHDLYTESFAGGLAVYFAKNKSNVEVINDTNDFVVNFYKVYQHNYNELLSLIESSLISRSDYENALKFQKSKCKIKRAWSFWYLCNFSFGSKIGGGFKYSKKSSTNVCKQLIIKKSIFKSITSKIENTVIENMDAIKLINKFDSSTAFHFVDPPYIGSNQGHYSGYKESDLIDLMNCLAKIEGKFLLTHYDHPIITKHILKNKWHYRKIKTTISAIVNQPNKKRIELLITNYREHNLFSK